METETPVIIRPSRDADVEPMLAIYRRHIRRGIEAGVEDSGTLQPDDLRDRRKNLRNRRLPHLVATHFNQPNLHLHHLGRGIGRLLMQALIDACAAAGFRQMIGYIDAENTASLTLHDRFGFAKVGLLPGVAYRYGKWSDSVMVQRSLGAGATLPAAPALPAI